MKIYFDVSTLNPNKVTGVGVYMLQLLNHFKQSQDLTLIPVVKLSRLKKKTAIEKFIGLKCEVLFPWKLWGAQRALYHGPDFKLNTRGFLPRVVTIHDMVVFEEKYNKPEFFLKGIRELTDVLKSSAVNAVVVNSEFTQGEVLKYFPHLKNKIYVTYLGCDRTSGTTLADSMGLPEKYILFLGTLEKRKNVVGVIKAFEIFKQQDRSEKLVLAGAWGFGAEEIQRAIEVSPWKQDIVHLSYVPNEKIAELYQRAQVFFFPSWYEGFGIPVLEAMSLGCPVVTSQGGALAEICEDAAVLVDPGSPEQMAQGLVQALGTQRDIWVCKGLKRAKQFTWEQCAQKTIQVYKNILRSI